MAINSNQFGMGPTLGQQDLFGTHASVISAILDPAYNGGNVVAGTFLKLITTSKGIPKVTPITANTDRIMGVALYSVKNGYYNNTVNDGALEMGMHNTVVYMNSAGAINAGQSVSPVFGTPGNVLAWAAGAQRVGFALDAATAAGQLIRVMLQTPNLAFAGE